MVFGSFAINQWWANSLRSYCTQRDTVFSMTVMMLIFSGMCILNLRIKRKIIIVVIFKLLVICSYCAGLVA